jgi:hypothetical protein
MPYAGIPVIPFRLGTVCAIALTWTAHLLVARKSPKGAPKGGGKAEW